MNSKPLTAAFCIIVIACQQGNSVDNKDYKVQRPATELNFNPFHIIADIPVTEKFTRLRADSASFAEWLRKRKFKKDKTVYLYNGEKKQNQLAQFAVLDISVGKKDLQQCADAVMRLRAEYLFDNKKFSEIIFTDNANNQYQFTRPYTKEHLHQYLQRVFGMCGTASLSKQLNNKNINEISPGDVLIRGGFPGHAAIVMDVAVDKAGKRIFMLAQSYMPAQDIHMLINPSDEKLSPWYEIEKKIVTPEYLFTMWELKKW